MAEGTNGVEVLVAGAGPVGLCTALGLARHGIRVTVLERKAVLDPHSRAAAIWSRTQEIFDDLGIIDSFEKQAILLGKLELFDADRRSVLLSLPLDELAQDTPFARLMILPQSATESLLLKALEAYPNAQVHFSHEVTEITQDAAAVRLWAKTPSGRQEWRAKFLVGCDGAHSFVRDSIGGELQGITYGIRAALADVTVDAEELSFPRLTLSPRLTIGIRIGSGLWRLIFPYSGRPGDDKRQTPPLEDWAAEAGPTLFNRPPKAVVWTSDFQLHRRLANLWVKNRVALAGDAAHLNSPVGGEGMNAGILDAAALYPRLAAAVQEDSPAGLPAYERERQAAVAGGVNAMSDLMTRLLLVRGGRYIRVVLRMVAMALWIGPLRRKVMRRLTLLDQD